MGQSKYEGLVNAGKNHFNGKIKVHYDSLKLPLKWKYPRVIFVNSMSDLFHEGVPDEFILAVFDVMAEAYWHTFQILTKRPDRILKVQEKLRWTRNIWIGTSVEDQRAVHRVSNLVQTGARTKFLSCEPLIGQIDHLDLSGIHWVIVGGESGPNAREMREEWLRIIIRNCAEMEVPMFLKQLGNVWARKRKLKNKKGSDISEFPSDLKIRQYPNVGQYVMNLQ